MPGLPKSSVTATNNGLGNVPDSPSRTQLKVGPATDGVLLELYYPTSKTDLAAEFVGGTMPEAAGTAMNEKGRGIVGVVRTAASTAGTCSAVTKTDPEGAVGTALVTPGSFVLAGADTDGDLLVTEKDVSGIYTLTTVVGGALGFTVVGLVVTLTVTVSTTATAAAAYLNAQPTAFAKFALVALGTGASVCVQASGPTSAVNGRLNVTALAPLQNLALVVPAGASAALSSTYVDPLITLNSATDTKKKPTTTGTLAAAELSTLAAANPGVFSVTAGGTGALPVGAMASTPLVFGSTGLMVISTATPNDAYVVSVLITTAGALGTAQAKWSLDGKVFSDPFVIPGSGIYAIPNTGIAVTFTGVQAVGDLHTFTCTAPSSTLADYSAAFDYLLSPTVTDNFSLIHLVTEVASADLAAFFVAVGSYADQLETAHHDCRIFIECARPTSAQTTAQWATAFKAVMSSLSHPRVSVWMMTCDLTASLDGAQRGRTMRRSGAWPAAARAGAFPVGRDIGDQSYGQPLTGVSRVYEIDQGETLALARFSVLYALSGVPGFHAEARLADAPTGDYTWLQYGRLIDEVQRLGYQLQTTLLSSSSRRRAKASGIYPVGSIDPGAADAIEQFLTTKLRQQLVVTGECTDVVAVVDRTNTTARLVVTYRAAPLIYFKEIAASAGLVLSTTQTV